MLLTTVRCLMPAKEVQVQNSVAAHGGRSETLQLKSWRLKSRARFRKDAWIDLLDKRLLHDDGSGVRVEGCLAAVRVEMRWRIRATVVREGAHDDEVRRSLRVIRRGLRGNSMSCGDAGRRQTKTIRALWCCEKGDL